MKITPDIEDIKQRKLTSKKMSIKTLFFVNIINAWFFLLLLIPVYLSPLMYANDSKWYIKGIPITAYMMIIGLIILQLFLKIAKGKTIGALIIVKK